MIPRPIYLLLLASLLTLAETSPINPASAPSKPHPQNELSPAYHSAFNLLWAALTAYQARISLRILQLPLEPKIRTSFTLTSRAIIARCISYLLAAAFAVIILPSWKLEGIKSGPSLIGTLADTASLIVDPLLFAAVFVPIHEHPWTLESLKTRIFSHETFDRVLLASLVVSIFAFIGVSVVHPGLFASGFDLLKSVYSVYLAIFAVLTIDCVVWGGIMFYRERNKGIVYPLLGYAVPFLGFFMLGIWLLRFIISVVQEEGSPFPIPLVMDFFSQIILHAVFYSITFCCLMGSRRENEIQNTMAISLGLTVAIILTVILILSRLFPGK